ncbi:MAG TPA: Gfo/Idh/MocA family oxidoreductase [Verrucomicrobiae bacterium]|jgi:predicted dehydrogenase|nr:Gfo/Idh/MocA family oxidoreductase [Verrucomicrobiae bacterium]
MTKPIKVGVVGCGYWGPNLIRNFRSLPDCNLKMMCDLSEDRLKHLKTLYPEVKGETDFSHMLNGAGLDAIVIATNLKAHYPMAKASLLAGKHTFIEKPMAASLSECEELLAIAQQKGLVLMIGHTFVYSAAVKKIKEIVEWGDLGDIRYISARRLNLGLFQRDINVAWDLASHDISIILHIMDEMPISVNCRGSAHITPGVEDVTSMCLTFRKDRSAIIHSSWLDPRKIREMTIVGSKRMIVYDDVAPLEKIRVFDVRVERPPHYDTFAEFHYAYHYGDVYAPYIKQEEPLKTECQHFLDCIRESKSPMSNGTHGVEAVKILEASSLSLKQSGSAVRLDQVEALRNQSANKANGLAIARSINNGISKATRIPKSNGISKTPRIPKLNGAAKTNGNGHGNGNGNGNGARGGDSKTSYRSLPEAQG